MLGVVEGAGRGVTRAISDTAAGRRSNGNKVAHNYNWNNESRARNAARPSRSRGEVGFGFNHVLLPSAAVCISNSE